LADITYNVLVNLDTKGNLTASLGGMNRQIGSMQSAATGVGHAIGGVVNGLRGAFEGVVESIAGVVSSVAKIGAVTGFAALTYGAFKLNRELEDTNMWFAGVFRANGLTNNMQEGMEAGARLMDRMRKDAAQLPGEFGDLKNIMQGSIMSGLSAGLSPDKLEKMSAQVMAMTAGQVPSQVVGRELGLLLSGRVTATNTVGRMLFGAGHMKELRNMSNEQRVEEITKALGKWQPAIETMKTSFTAMWTTTIDGAKRFLEVLTKPMFNVAKQFLGEFSFLDENGELGGRARYWAQTLGQRLANAMVMAHDKILEWWPSIKHFATEAFFELRDIWLKLEPIVEGFGSKLKGLMDTGQLVPTIEKILALYAGSKMMGGLGAIMPSGGSLLSIANILGGGGGMGGMGGLFGGGMGAMAGAGGVALVSAGVALASMFHVLTDSTSEFHAVSMRYTDQIGHNFESMKGGFELLGDAISPVINALGTLDLGMISLYTHIGSLVSEIAKGIGHHIKDTADALSETFLGKSYDEAVGVGLKHKEIKDKSVGKKVEEIHKDLLKQTVNGAGGGGGGVHVDKVEINIASNADPSRIARMTVAHLAELKRRTGVSPYSKNFSRVNP